MDLDHRRRWGKPPIILSTLRHQRQGSSVSLAVIAPLHRRLAEGAARCELRQLAVLLRLTMCTDWQTERMHGGASHDR
jgi:hypothetical protein